MNSYFRALSALSLGGALIAMGCGSVDEDGTASTGNDTQALHSKGKGGSKGTGGSAGTGGSTDPAAIIAAAQTPDGRAIPQPPGPNGQCAPVVALLGFWSCVNQGDVCSYKTGTVTHSCTCVRVDGEGQNPAWLCN